MRETLFNKSVNCNSILTRFLILDPHYTGQEDLTTILKKVRVW